MASTKKQEKNIENAQATRLPFVINDQYVKDMSFENVNYMLRYQEQKEQPQVTVNVETNVARIDETHYEVVMKVEVKSFVGTTDLFVLEILYGAIADIDKSFTGEALETILLVHCPFLMFPFVRRIVSETISSGGYPPLLIDPIDFASLYVERKQAENQKATETKN